MDTNTVEKLQSYKQMLDSGIINEEEFNALKKQLLDGVIVPSVPVQEAEPVPVPVEPVRAFAPEELEATDQLGPVQPAEPVSVEPEPVQVPPEQPTPFTAQPQEQPQAFTAPFKADGAETAAVGAAAKGFMSKLSKGAKIGIAAGVVAIVLLIVLLGKGGASKEEAAVIGRWECQGVYLSGQTFMAADLGLTDDYITFSKDGKFTMNIGDNDRSGTWEYSETRATGGVDYYFYPLTLSTGDKWLVLYNTDKKLITLFVQSSLDSENFILYSK